MADDENQVLEEARRRPLAERVAHKLWKARVEVYGEMSSKCEKVFSEEDPLLNTYGPYLAKAVIDTNAAALDKGLEFTIEYLKKCSVAQAAKVCKEVCNGLISKALSGRVGTVQKSVEVCLLLVEDEQADKVVEIFLAKGITHKVPKVSLICVDILYQCVNHFGTKVVSPQPILKALPPLFDTKDAKIRDKVKELVAELAKWVGANAVKAVLFEKMRDAMKEDVEKLIAQTTETRPSAKRLTRNQQQRQEVEESAPGGGQSSGVNQPDDEPEETEVDEYDLAEPSEVVGQLGRDWWANLQEKKWSIRKGALTSLKTLASKPRLAPGDYSEINRELKKIITKDSNVQCVAEACWCVAMLAKGLRKDFPSAKSYCSMLLEKFKEKNMSVNRANMEALTNLQCYCFSLLDVQDEVQEALKHQNPKVKQDTLEWMKICLDRATKAQAAKMMPVFNAAVASCADDATPQTRDRAMDVLVAFCMKATSAAAVDKIAAKLDDTRKKKLDEMLKEAREAKGKQGASAGNSKVAKPQEKAPVAPPPRGVPMEVDPPAPKKKSKKSSSQTAKGSAGPSKPAASTKTSAKAPTKYIEDVDEERLKSGAMAKEGAERGFTELFGDEVVPGLNSSVWKERLTALDTMYEKLPSLDMGLHGTLLIQGIAVLPGWTEKIFQVLGKEFEVIKYVVDTSQALSKSDAYAAIVGLVEKIADIKLKTQSQEILLLICEHVGLHFVFSLIYSLSKKHRNPKVLSEGLNWMKTAIQEFGIGPWIDVRTVINWLVEELNNTIPAVKNAAVGLIGCLHKFVGPPLAEMVRPNVKPTLMPSIEAEFEKNPQDGGFSAKRKLRGCKAPAASMDGNEMIIDEPEPEQEFNPDDLLPRADISEQINNGIAALLNSSNWKERKEGLEAVEKLLVDSGSRIQPTVGDLFPALKGRLTDSNKNLIAQAIKVLSKLAVAMGRPIEKQGKSILEPALLSLSDAKPNVRAAVIELMDSWCSVAPLASLMPEFIAAVGSPKSHIDGKKDAFTWITKMATEGKITKDALESCVQACGVGLTDKAQQVRDASSEFLKTLLEKFGDAVQSLTKSAENRDAIIEAMGKLGGSQSIAAPGPSKAIPETKSARPATPQKASRKGESKIGKKGTKEPVAAPPVEAQPLLKFNNDKEDRGYRNRGKRAKFDSIPPDEEPSLKAELSPFVADHLHTLLFAPDFQKHCKAAELIKDALNGQYEEILSNLDYIFRWSVLRIVQGKIQALTAVLEMLKSIFEKLASESYKLSEYEAVILLPCIVEKSGHNQDRIKKIHREIISLATTVYPTSKVFNILSQGLISKNNRTRVECIEEIGSMIDREGIKIALGSKNSKVFEEIAAAVSDRDKAVRSACLSTLTTAYDFEGKHLWKLMGRLDNQQKGLIEERFKAHHRTLQEKRKAIGYRGSRPSTPINPKSRLPTPDQLRKQRTSQHSDSGSANDDMFPRPASQISGRSLHSPMPLPDPPEMTVPQREIPTVIIVPPIDLPPVNTQAKPAAQARASPVEISVSPIPPPAPEEEHKPPARSDSVIEEVWSRAMIMIQSEDIEESIESLKIICYELDKAKAEGTPGTVLLLKDSASELVKELVVRLQKFVTEIVEAIENSQRIPPERPCKYTLNTLLQTFLTPFMAPMVEKDLLLELVSTLLGLLLDDRLTKVPEGRAIMKLMNVLMLRVLETAQLNSVISVLIFLLRMPPPKIIHGGPELNSRFFNLVVKCLIKTTKRMGALLESESFNEMEFNISAVLLEIHDFFEKLGPDELRKRGEEEDKPLRMVKTVLYEICRFKGSEISNYLDPIPKHGSPPPIILAYIDVNLQTLHSTGVLKGPAPVPVGRGPSVIQDYFRSIDGVANTAQSNPPPGSPSRSTGRLTPENGNQDLKTELAVIFKKIGDKSMTQHGMECLYQFQLDHPQVDVNPFLRNTSENFRAYIEKNLKLIAEKRKVAQSDPMEVEESEERLEDTPITWTEPSDGHYVANEHSYHQPINS